jgi:predicted alpha/beta superfamily hydrolase
MRDRFDPRAEAGDSARRGLLLPPVSDTHLLASAHVDQTFKIQVLRPPRTNGDERRFPAVYATDGNLTFDLLKALSYQLAGAPTGIPPFLLVTIGYPSDSPYAGSILRMRDLTAAPFPRIDPRASPVEHEGVLIAAEGSPDFYGAPAFLRFIIEELFPFIEAGYETAADDRTYFGHSLGGFFGLYTLLTGQACFRNYILSSPSLSFHGVIPSASTPTASDFGLEMVESFIATGNALPDTKLYISAGEDEESELWLWGNNFTSSASRVGAVIKAAAIPGLKVVTELLPGDTHSTVMPSAFTRGLRTIWDARDLPQFA